MAPPDRPEGVWGEVERLRSWRHDVDKVLAAYRLELESVRGRLQAAEATITELEPQVERMARAQEIADAVTENLHAHRSSLLTIWEKLAGVAVGIAALVSIALQLTGH